MKMYKITAGSGGVIVKELEIIKETEKTYRVSGGWESVINKDKIDNISVGMFGETEVFSLDYNPVTIESMRFAAIKSRKSKIENLREEIEKLNKPFVFEEKR